MKYYELISKLNKLQAKYDKLKKALIEGLKGLDNETFDNVDFETTLKIRDLITRFEGIK